MQTPIWPRADHPVQRTIYRTAVRPELGDYNGHLNVAGYAQLFDEATAVFLGGIDVGEGYARRAGHSTFVLEAHVRHLAEVLVGEEIEVETLMMGHDRKRLLYLHVMRRAGHDAVVAAQEQLSIHVSLSTRRSCDWPPEAVAMMGAPLPVDPALLSARLALRP